MHKTNQRNTYAETNDKLGKWQVNLDRRVLAFVEKGPTYSGN